VVDEKTESEDDVKIMWPWNRVQAELNAKLVEFDNRSFIRSEEIEKQIAELSKHVEELRLSQKSEDEQADIQLDSNWHLRRRQLERAYAKERTGHAE
jgi:serine phosphatase RsbU (regulator of sigma subunit)